jgi:hypothetical protein
MKCVFEIIYLNIYRIIYMLLVYIVEWIALYLHRICHCDTTFKLVCTYFCSEKSQTYVHVSRRTELSQKSNKAYLQDLVQKLIGMQYYCIWSRCMKIVLLLIADLGNLLYGEVLRTNV